jgi:hypothetical protein
MYFPDDIWHHLKLFIFKSIEMINYDKILLNLNEINDKIKYIDSKKFKVIEDKIFNNWLISKRILFLNEVRREKDNKYCMWCKCSKFDGF